MAGPGAACSPRPLVAACLTAGEDLQGVHSHLWVVNLWATVGQVQARCMTEGSSSHTWQWVVQDMYMVGGGCCTQTWQCSIAVHLNRVLYKYSAISGYNDAQDNGLRNAACPGAHNQMHAWAVHSPAPVTQWHNRPCIMACAVLTDMIKEQGIS